MSNKHHEGLLQTGEVNTDIVRMGFVNHNNVLTLCVLRL